MTERFASFGQWLVETAGPERAARDAPRYAGFFAEVGETWGDIPEYAVLVAHFSAEGLRRRRRALRWMVEKKLVTVDGRAREDDSERRRIAASIEKLPEGSRGRGVVNDYASALGERARAGSLSRRSMRLAITPAMALLDAALAAERELPSQQTLDGLLRKAPAQRSRDSCGGCEKRTTSRSGFRQDAPGRGSSGGARTHAKRCSLCSAKSRAPTTSHSGGASPPSRTFTIWR